MFDEKKWLCYATNFQKGKSMRYLSTILLSVLALGCSRSNECMTRYHEDGRAKPVVSIAPMIDTSSFEAPWSVSEELTSQVISQIGQAGKIFITAKEDDAFSENPFGTDLSWIKREFHEGEFVVFLELVEHEIVAANKSKKDLPSQEVSSNLNMAIRLRVVDIRNAAPKIVLQEIIRETYFIPKSLTGAADYQIITWGMPEFTRSHMGIAHNQLIKEISSRVSDYVLLAKSR